MACATPRNFAGITDEMIRPHMTTARKVAEIYAAKSNAGHLVDEFYSSALVGVAAALRTWDSQLATSTIDAWVARKCRQTIIDDQREFCGRDRGAINPRKRFEVATDFIESAVMDERSSRAVEDIDNADELKVLRKKIGRKMPVRLRRAFDLTCKGFCVTEIAKILGRCVSSAHLLVKDLAKWLAGYMGDVNDWWAIRDAMPKQTTMGHHNRKSTAVA